VYDSPVRERELLSFVKYKILYGIIESFLTVFISIVNRGVKMSKTTVTKINDLAKWGLLSCMAVLVLAALVPTEPVNANESGKECAVSVSDFGLPELGSEIVIPRKFDKEMLFKMSVQSFDSCSTLFSVNGFEIEEFDRVEHEVDNTYASGKDFDGLSAGVTEYESGSLETGDILKAIPSISTKDEKTLGILVPPFAYFSKKF